MSSSKTLDIVMHFYRFLRAYVLLLGHVPDMVKIR
jgi:hypothetical protein